MFLIMRCKLVRNFVALTDGRISTVQISASKRFYSPSASYNPDSQPKSLDKSLRRLDQDVRRFGRISKKEFEEALGELKTSQTPTTTQSLLVIRCCGSLLPEEPSHLRTQLAEDVWKMLHNMNVPLDISHYNALLRVYLENEHPFSPTEFLGDLERKGIEPNRVTYQRLVERYCQGGDINGATHILEFMRNKGLPVNENIFNSLILGHSQAGDMKSAADMLSVMKNAGLEPSAETYKTLLCGYAKYGDMQAIRTTLDLCEKDNITLFNQDYMDIVYALANNGHTDYVDEIVEKLKFTTGFNQEAYNLVLKLTNQKKFEVAKKILFLMSRGVQNGQLLPSGTFFIKQLIKADCPIPEVLNICQELKEKGMNNDALSLATEYSLLLGNVENSLLLLSKLKDCGYPIRQHYFWPLIISKGKAGNIEGILEILNVMPKTFGLSVSGETLRDYAIPWLHKLNTNSQDLISSLQLAGVPLEVSAPSFVHHLLLEGNLADAHRIVKKFPVFYAGLLQNPIIKAYQRTKDHKALAGLLSAINVATERAGIREQDLHSMSEPIPDRHEIIGQLVFDAISKQKNHLDVKLLLEALWQEGLRMSNSNAERLVEKLGDENLTAEISTLLEKLTSAPPYSQPGKSKSSLPSFDDEMQLTDIMKKMSDKGMPVINVKKQLLSLFCRNNNLEKADSMWQDISKTGAVLSPLLVVQLFDLYLSHEKKEEAMSLIKWAETHLNDFVLNRLRVVKLGIEYVKDQEIEDAIKLLNYYGPIHKPEENTYAITAACRQLLTFLADQGSVETVKKMFDTLLQNNYIEVSNIMLGSLIKVHIVRGDLDGAVNEFENLSRKYHCTPLKNELTGKLIEAEDAASLQRITDLSTKVHGEVNSLYDLVFTFIECGRIRQARKILETPGLMSRPERVQMACKRFSKEGMVSSLEGLVEATKSLPNIDQSNIYQHLLVTYCKKDDVKNARELWEKMQEDNIQPTDEFLIVLGTFLQKKGLTVPFVIPTKDRNSLYSNKEFHLDTSPSEKIASVLSENNFLEALSIFTRMNNSEKNQVPRKQLTSLLEGLKKCGRMEDVKNLLFLMLDAKINPPRTVLKNVVDNISLAGDVHSLEFLGKYLDTVTKRMVAYEDNLCRAYEVAGKSNEYLDLLENEIKGANVTEVLYLFKFPKSTILDLLKSNPQLHSRFKKLCEQYFALGFSLPFNMLWIFYAMNHEYSSADEIWNNYLFKSSGLEYGLLSQYARDKKDLPLAKYVVDRLKESTIENTSHGYAYSCVIDILLAVGKPEEALAFVEKSKDVLSYKNLTKAVRLKIEKIAEEQRIPVEGLQKVAD